jgi:hypothetical protein
MRVTSCATLRAYSTSSPTREFYGNARVTVAVKFRSQWALRVQTGEKLDYESKLARQPDRFPDLML